MTRRLEPLVDLWIGRYSRPDPVAQADTLTREPAVVVTGGSYGIGAAIAAEFARRRTHAIVLVARREGPLKECSERLTRTFGIRVEILPIDLTASDSTTRLVDAVTERGLYIDYLVANAGIGMSGPFAEAKVQSIQAVLDLNIRSVTALVRATLPAMIARGRGGILTVASLGGYVPGPNQALYYASKAFVISLTEALRHEVRGCGVRVAVVAPGPVATSFHETMGASSAIYRDVLPQETSERVARSAVRGFMLGRTVIVPGLLATLLAWILRITPHPVSVPLVEALLRRRGRQSVEK